MKQWLATIAFAAGVISIILTALIMTRVSLPTAIVASIAIGMHTAYLITILCSIVTGEPVFRSFGWYDHFGLIVTFPLFQLQKYQFDKRCARERAILTKASG
jgi:hypothetical protein